MKNRPILARILFTSLLVLPAITGDGRSRGGATAGARNVISGNGRSGIGMGGTGTLVQGNFIGTNAAGAAAIPNSEAGIEISNSPGHTIGGTTGAARNVISGNPGAGIKITEGLASRNLIQGNLIGVAADGVAPLPNSTAIVNSSGGGVINRGSDNTVGGAVSGAGNVIANNGNGGVLIIPLSDQAFNTGNAVRGNSIFSNKGLGIELIPFGPTANDDCDRDAGANNLQNYPVITSVAASGAQTVVRGSLNSAASATCTLEFFANAACNASGFGEGQTLLGSLQVTTDANCAANVEATFPVAVPAGQFITTTATDSAGRWPVERDYKELKAVGLGDYEVRGWRGFHHHATMCIAAYAFLIGERGLFSLCRNRRTSGGAVSRISGSERSRCSIDTSGATQPNLDRDHEDRVRRCNGQACPSISGLPKNQRSHVIISWGIREFCDTAALMTAPLATSKATCVAR